MARGGFLSRVTRTVRGLFTRPSPPPRERPREPPPPPRPPPDRGRGGGAGPAPRDEYRQIWEDVTDEASYQHFADHREVFFSIPGIMTETDHSERLELWESYVRNMVVGSDTGGRRDDISRNPFWGEVGITPRRFDWQDWRMAMGYSKAGARR